MKSFADLKKFRIPKEQLKFINGSTSGGCQTACEDACWHFIVVTENEPSMSDLQNCQSDCSFFC
ncbi:hypothetical protein ACWGOQ_0017290 [Aquimarina sp. M1]